MTVATAVLVHALDVDAIPAALLLALVVGVGYAAAVSLTNAVTPHTPHPLIYGAVTGSHHLVGIAIASVIVVSLR